MLFDTAYEKKCLISTTLGLPRWYKRVHYYIYKICYNFLNSQKLSNLPGYKVREFLSKGYSVEFEKLKFFYILKKNLPLWRRKFKKINKF